jgi:hypothetical protein
MKKPIGPWHLCSAKLEALADSKNIGVKTICKDEVTATEARVATSSSPGTVAAVAESALRICFRMLARLFDGASLHVRCGDHRLSTVGPSPGDRSRKYYGGYRYDAIASTGEDPMAPRTLSRHDGDCFIAVGSRTSHYGIMKLAITSPNRDKYSETFIRMQMDRLLCELRACGGGASATLCGAFHPAGGSFSWL